MTNQGDKLAVASDLNPNDAKSILGVLEGDALDHPRQHLAVGCFMNAVTRLGGVPLAAEILLILPG